MMKNQAHIINHTHWDREWFLTSIYTRRWIPGLIDRLEELIEANPEFTYFFDGQTLVIEDLIAVAPEYEGRVRRLIENGSLLIGPYYCQPDWQITGGELLLRNLIYGLKDVRKFGGAGGTGWLVDTFGHIRQSPQIHCLAGIEQVYVWRGVPALEPYFDWQSPDGSQVLAIYLLGGYRNLYGVTHVPDVAVRRLTAEVERLAPYYPTPDIPLFDGYDLEDDPEDPLRFYAGVDGIGSQMVLQQSTPAQFAQTVQSRGKPFPTLQSELNSGKFGAIFPGTLSARIYLKLMASDCEHLLYRRCEPLAVMAQRCGRPYPAEQYEAWGRSLLQNAVHDGICGVSIDGVHEKMEFIYRQVFDGALADLQESLDALLSAFKPGDYAVSTSPFAAETCQVVGDRILSVQTGGVGVWPVEDFGPVLRPDRPVTSYRWQNRHYTAEMNALGAVQIGEATFGRLTVRREQGDTYSEEGGEVLGVLEPVSPLKVLEKSEWHAVVGFDAAWEQDDQRVTARVQVHFDRSPILRWTINLDSRGADLRVDLAFESGLTEGIQAGMPFDCVPRGGADADLLPRQLDGDLASILLGQRELGTVATFPFQEYLALCGGDQTAAIFARGLRAYTVDGPGRVRLPLRRSVEWLTRAGLQERVGDAGPFFYVPDARCERSERHELGLVLGHFSPDGLDVVALNESFQTPPLIVSGGAGTHSNLTFFQEDLPLSSLYMENGRAVARVYNPSGQPQRLSNGYTQFDLAGQPAGQIDTVDAGKIVMLALELPGVRAGNATGRAVLHTPPAWRVGHSTSRPDPAVIALLGEQAAALERELLEVQAALEAAAASQKLRLQHRAYVLERELVEYLFSRLLNEQKLARQGPATEKELFEVDDEVAALGLRLNKLRIKRRIFDYVVGVL
jgi:alpha-mannosidase